MISQKKPCLSLVSQDRRAVVLPVRPGLTHLIGNLTIVITRDAVGKECGADAFIDDVLSGSAPRLIEIVPAERAFECDGRIFFGKGKDFGPQAMPGRVASRTRLACLGPGAGGVAGVLAINLPALFGGERLCFESSGFRGRDECFIPRFT